MNVESAISRQVVLGSTVEVVGGQPQYRGLQGTICNESKNMLWLSSRGTIKGVPKRSNAFLVNGSFFVSGDLLVGRFFDRLVK